MGERCMLGVEEENYKEGRAVPIEPNRIRLAGCVHVAALAFMYSLSRAHAHLLTGSRAITWMCT